MKTKNIYTEYSALHAVAAMGQCTPGWFAHRMSYKAKDATTVTMKAPNRLNHLTSKGLLLKVLLESEQLRNGETYNRYVYKLSELGVYRLFFYDTINSYEGWCLDDYYR